jgi:hypothetical protein
MPITYEIDPELELLYYAGIGQIKTAEIILAEQAVAADPRRLPNMKIIVDLLQAEVDLDLRDIYEGIRLNQRRVEKGKVLEATAVISTSRFSQTFADTFRLLSDGLPIKFCIFTTLPDAVRWLELSEHEEKIQTIQKELRHQLSAQI